MSPLSSHFDKFRSPFHVRAVIFAQELKCTEQKVPCLCLAPLIATCGRWNRGWLHSAIIYSNVLETAPLGPDFLLLDLVLHALMRNKEKSEKSI